MVKCLSNAIDARPRQWPHPRHPFDASSRASGFFGQNLVKQNRYNQGLRKHINIYIYIPDLVHNIYIYILNLVYYISIFFANAYIYRERTSNQLPVAPRTLSSRTATAVIRTSVANPAGNTKPSTGWNLRDRPARHGGKFPIMRCKIQFHVGIFSWLYDGLKQGCIPWLEIYI